MASAVTEEDNRKVQTAVLGGSQGHQEPTNQARRAT